MSMQSESINRFRFRAGNGVSHPVHGAGLIDCPWGDDSYFVRFDGETRPRVVATSELTSLPSRGISREGTRKQAGLAGQQHAKATKAERELKKAKARAKLKQNQGKTRTL